MTGEQSPMMKKTNLCASGMAPAKLRLSPSIVPTLRKVPQFTASDCVRIHTRGGLVQLFSANDSENQRHGGCSIASQDVHQNGGKDDERKRPNEDSDRL